MPAQVVSDINTSHADEITVSFLPARKDGMSVADKMLVTKLLKEMTVGQELPNGMTFTTNNQIEK